MSLKNCKMLSRITTMPISPFVPVWPLLQTTLPKSIRHKYKTGRRKILERDGLPILGRTGKKVLLVDADLRSPSIHGFFNRSNEKGLSNFLAGSGDWRSLTQQTDTPNLSILSAGPIPPSAAELLSGDGLSALIAESLEKFDHIIIDAPPVLGMTDAPLLAAAVEGVVYVVQSAGAAAAVNASTKRIRVANANIVGAIL